MLAVVSHRQPKQRVKDDLARPDTCNSLFLDASAGCSPCFVDPAQAN
jgi:hypothetical protein